MAGDGTELAADEVQLIVAQRGSIPRPSQKICSSPVEHLPQGRRKQEGGRGYAYISGAPTVTTVDDTTTVPPAGCSSLLQSS